jgi:tungstate transport system ATP-binding protein
LSRAMYEVSHLRHRYADQTVLEISDLRIRQGSIVGLVGPNGSGKSTLLKILAFLEPPSEGRVRFNGRKAHIDDPAIRHQVTLLLQDPYLLKRSVFDNVAYGPRVRGEATGLRQRVEEALVWVGLAPASFASRGWHELSGGEAQRVALASRLILRPRVLLLDEPTASVDAASAQLIQEASVRAREEWGTTLVIASHDLQWLHKVCDEVLNFFNGRIVGAGEENLIEGPWAEAQNGMLRKVLSDGQEILVTPPPNQECVALLDPSRLDIATEPPVADQGRNILSGTISQMSFEAQSGEIVVDISVCSTFFTLRTTRQRVEELCLHPGRSVWVSFEPVALHWV